jgi:hypothetical protein
MLTTIEHVRSLLAAGKTLFLAGDEGLLRQLPRGDWIGGTIPYFMDADGGVISKTLLFATEAPAVATSPVVKTYGIEDLARIPADAAENGFSILILPASSGVHVDYARHAPDYPGLFLKPIIGWVAGVHLDDLGKVTPKVLNGQTGEVSESRAVAMHLTLPDDHQANIGIVNLFQQGRGDVITFDTEGFSVQMCRVNGSPTNLAEYLTRHEVDTRLPLVADYCGTRVNVSIQAVDQDAKSVALYAPVFKGVEYRVAAPVADYVGGFTSAMAGTTVTPAFSCNCILNFLYSNLEGKKTGAITGPVTFGEVAYQLLNQTLTYLEVRRVDG